MRVKYNRVSTLQQTGDRFTEDKEYYDLVLLDKVSGSIGFKDRPKGSELAALVEAGKVSEIVIHEFSRIGRNVGDCIKTLEWLESKEVNVVVRNIGLQSRPDGKRNPIWKMISSIMSSLYEMELENIKERTMVGRQVYIQRGGFIGRPSGTKESPKEFLLKPKNQEIIKLLERGRRYSEIVKILDCSPKTISKVKSLMAPTS